MTQLKPTWLERLTALALLLVISILGWLLFAEDLPAWLRLAGVEMEVIAIGALLVVALTLVSWLALRHTR